MAPKAKLSDSAHLSAIVQSSADAIITKDLNGVITSWNGAAEQVFGYTADEAVGMPVTMLIPDDHLDEEPGILARIRRGEKVEHYETIRQRKDGRLIDISLTVSPIYDEGGTVIGASKIVRDVSDRKRTDAELTKLAAIVENSSDAIITKDLNGIITSWNHGAEQIFGYTADEVIGKPVTILMPEDRVDEEPGIIARIRRGERVEHYETVRRRKDGTLLDIALTVSPVRDQHGEIIGASKIARDVTEHKRVQSAEREAELMHRLVQTQEAERRRIARDLHDSIGQYMTAMRLTIEGLAKRCEDDPEMTNDLETVKDLASRIDRDISFMTWQLRPTEVEMLGLRDALKTLVEEWSNHSSIAAEFEFVGEDGPLPPLVDTNVYRVVQEALNNIAKHADAKEVSILMHRKASHIFVIVEDDGKGFDPNAVELVRTDGHGQGLIGMRERAELLGGSLSIESVKGRGTSVIVRVPLHAETNGNAKRATRF
jgi:PAS domain S-box-containing protein